MISPNHYHLMHFDCRISTSGPIRVTAAFTTVELAPWLHLFILITYPFIIN